MHQKIIRIKAVNEVLKNLHHDYVFVGGATVSLYATNPVEKDIRPTDDVDVVVELATYKGYSDLDEKLRAIGFKNDIFSGVLCRYTIQGIIVDVMPTDDKAIGFSNRWYPEGFQNAVQCKLDAEHTVNVFSLPYFIASKWEAFKGRGTDFRTSTDFDDLVYIFKNVDDLDDQIREAPFHLYTYLQDEFSRVLDLNNFEEGLIANLRGSMTDIDEIKDKLRSSLNLDPPSYGY